MVQVDSVYREISLQVRIGKFNTDQNKVKSQNSIKITDKYNKNSFLNLYINSVKVESLRLKNNRIIGLSNNKKLFSTSEL